jgi:hypothetical protein
VSRGPAARSAGLDGTGNNLSVTGTVLRDNTAREGGGGIFFVVNSGGGTLQIEDTQPVVTGSAIG